MIEFFQNMTFLRPQMFWLALPVFILMMTARKNFAADSAWKKVCEQKFLNYLLIKKSNQSAKNSRFLTYFALLSAVFALSGPSFEKMPEPALAKLNPLMIVLDLSESMNRTDVRPSRLNRAKIEITDILKTSQASPSGLIVYTNEPFLISPLSEDSNIIINLLKAVETNIMPAPGNRADRAVDLALERLKEAGFLHSDIVIFSAGLDDKDVQKAVLSAQKAYQSGVRVSTYDMGVAASQNLQKVAKAGNGVYVNVMQNNDKPLLELIKSAQNNDLQKSQNLLETQVDNGWIFVLIPAFLMLLMFKRGVLSLFLVLILTQNASAGFLFNANQEGALAFSSGEYQKAAEKFDDEKWKASAYYKAGNYQKAAELYGKQNDVQSLYNKGNALAKAGDINAAIKTYEDVLKQMPEHEDAKFNLEYLKKLKQDQNKQENQKKEQNQTNQDKQSSAQNQNNEDAEQNPQNQKENDNQPQNENDKPQDNTDEQDEQQSSGADETDEQDNQSSKSDKPNDNNHQKSNQSLEKHQAPVLNAKQDKAPKYDENVQARMQRFREIKDDPGGLLKAFIQQEYLKKRYND